MNLRICFIGDSFVHGTGDPDCLGWAGRISRAARGRGHNVTYYNLGIRRDTSRDVAARWEREALCRFPNTDESRLVFSFGANDCQRGDGWQRIEAEETLATAGVILTRAQEIGPTLMVGPPAMAEAAVAERVAALSARLGRLCDGLGVGYLETFTAMKASAHWLPEAAAADGTHPGAGGYGDLAALVEGWEPWRRWLP